MIRLREISDPDLRRRLTAALADARGLSPAAVPDWYELDDADVVDLLNAIRDEDQGVDPDGHDPRM